jgi:pyruvate/2-oxoglutarate dehydrogenase complex dihydrolipoamide acyltransferase (E2) component
VKATISVDHRVSDGAEAAQPKVQKLAEFLENPVRMLA